MKLLYLLAADAILFTHVLIVMFVVLGLVLIVAGRRCGWDWVRNPWFRVAHLTAIGMVVLQSWVEVVCPLTRWEMALRTKAGDAVYDGGFIAHWLETLLYIEAPGWAFTTAYTTFGALVAATWWWVRPRPFRQPQK